MNLNVFIKDFQNFLEGNEDREAILFKLGAIEDELLDMEDSAKNKDQAERDVILQILEALDNIHMLLDESDSVEEDEFRHELGKLMRLQKSQDNFSQADATDLKILSGPGLFPVSEEYSLPKPPQVTPQRVGGEISSEHARPASVSKSSQVTPQRVGGEISSEHARPAAVSTSSQVSPQRVGCEISSEHARPASVSKPPHVPSQRVGGEMTSEHARPAAGEHRLSQPRFDFHPTMKSRMPLEDEAEDLPEDDDVINIALKSSPLYNLLHMGKGASDIDLLDFENVLEITYRDIIDIKRNGSENQNDQAEYDFSQVLVEILEVLSDMSEAMKEENFQDEMVLFIKELDALNKDFIVLQNKLPPKKLTEEDLLEHVLDRISEEDFITSNYLLVEDISQKFIDEEIDQIEFKKLLNEMFVLIRTARQEYEEAYISPDEWTLEVSMGDRFLMEGLNEWEEGLEILDKCSSRKENMIKSAVKLIYEANKKLVINQYLADYIKEQVKVVSEYTSQQFL